jgi:hypothetical protein
VKCWEEVYCRRFIFSFRVKTSFRTITRIYWVCSLQFQLLAVCKTTQHLKHQIVASIELVLFIKKFLFPQIYHLYAMIQLVLIPSFHPFSGPSCAFRRVRRIATVSVLLNFGYCFMLSFPAGVSGLSVPKTSCGLFSLLFGSFRGYFPGNKVA